MLAISRTSGTNAMSRPRLAFPVIILLVSVAFAAAADPAPSFVDDDDITEKFTEKLSALAKDGKCLPVKKLRTLAEKDKVGDLQPVQSDGKPLPAEDVYRKALPSVFLIGSVLEDKESKTGYVTGRLATAWVLAADGVLVTNWHVFDQIQDGEFYGVMDHAGKVYPLTDILAMNKNSDVALVKVDAKGLSPLPVASVPPAVASWVAVLGHPGDRHFTFTQGHVSRFNKYNDPETKKSSKWMAVTAEYAYGSSGSPVLDKNGAVVGMAALTENIDYPDDEAPAANAIRKRMVRRLAQKPKDDKPKEPQPKAEPAAPKGSALQMVVKLTVPVTELRAVFGGKE